MKTVPTIYDGCLPLNFRMIVSGSSATGKSTFVEKLVNNDNGILTKDFDKIIYLQGVETDSSKRLQEKFRDRMIVFDGIPPERVLLPLCKEPGNCLLVIEDLDQQACSSPLVSKFFTVFGHHYDVSLILSTQNIFCPGKERLTLVRNATHIVLFPNYLDFSVVRLIAQRVHPRDPKKLVELFEKLTSEPYGYLSIWGNCDPILKFRSHITESVQKVYDLTFAPGEEAEKK